MVRNGTPRQNTSSQLNPERKFIPKVTFDVVMEVRSQRYRSVYNLIHRTTLVTVLIYVGFIVLSAEELATYAAGFLYVVLVPSLCYTYFQISKTAVDYAVPYSLVILILGLSSVVWLYLVAVESVSATSTYLPAGILCVGLLSSVYNMYSKSG